VDHTYGDFRARREASVWRRLNRILLVLLIIAIWLVIVSLFAPPYKKLMQSRAEIDNLQQQVNEQQSLLARQTREVNLLKMDVTYLETIARDRLDLMKEGETIFRLDSARAKPKPNDHAQVRVAHGSRVLASASSRSRTFFQSDHLHCWRN
jgi:cell division protein FtsB